MATLKQAFEKLRAFALRYPDVREDIPWGESAFKVKDKIFVFTNVTKDATAADAEAAALARIRARMPCLHKPTPTASARRAG